ncbi:hypothetical protein K3495_g4502 [Podosphaera aphanis]|nr:hypothetical protein K3495_g4502 [Podosphaera aphanis]
MPYTSPSSRSPTCSAPQSPNSSRTSSKTDLPRSTAYLSRHRRSTSLNSSPCEPKNTDDPASTAVKNAGNRGSKARYRLSSSRTNEKHRMPGTIISPPETASNSSDEDCSKPHELDRRLENLAQLKSAIQAIEQHQETSPTRAAEGMKKAKEALALLAPQGFLTESSSTLMEGISWSKLHKLMYSSSAEENTKGSVAKVPQTPLLGSDEDMDSDLENSYLVQKPPMVRKKSGELVRPALRPSSARRRPTSMPGTPTFSKAVHFDAHLEHIRHFLQVDRPLAVSAGSSPVPGYDSDTEFPFGGRSSPDPPFRWEIIVSNFPADSPLRMAQPVRVERVFLSADNEMLVGTVAVANLDFKKFVVVRFTLDYWKTTSEVVAEYNQDVRNPIRDGYDRFNFNIKLSDQANLEAKTMFFCVKYCVKGMEYWDNNNSTNYQVDFHKKKVPRKANQDLNQAVPTKPLPRSNHKLPVLHPKATPLEFDEFADGFREKYQFSDFKKAVNEYLGESGPIRLKGVKSSTSSASDNPLRNIAQPNGNAFGNRYDFGASLNAAINAKNSGSERGQLFIKTSIKRETPSEPVSPLSEKPATFLGPTGSNVQTIKGESPRPTGTEKPCLSSQSYSDLLSKYCFFGSTKGSPQLKDGTLQPDQIDGSHETGYNCMLTNRMAPKYQVIADDHERSSNLNLGSKATRPATNPSTPGYSPSIFPMYPNLHDGYPFMDTHTATAIRGQ